MINNHIILNPGQEKIVTAAVKFLNSDGAQVFEYAGAAGT